MRTAVNSFKSFVDREKTLSAERKDIYFLYISYFYKMLNTIESQNRKKAEALFIEIEETSALLNKMWLLTQLRLYAY